MTIGVDVLLDHPVGVNAAFENVVDVLQVRVPVVLGGQLLPSLLLQSLSDITKHLTQRIVDS